MSEAVYGTKGSSQVNRFQINGEKAADDAKISPYVQEHIDLIRSIREGKPLNELEQVANSTMTAILRPGGRVQRRDPDLGPGAERQDRPDAGEPDARRQPEDRPGADAEGVPGGVSSDCR